jgi:hypothetical protein
MTLALLRRIAVAGLTVALSGCVASGTFDPGSANTGADNRRAFPAVRISASWSAGKTGLPSASTATPPPGSFGTLCAANTFAVENHPTQYTSSFADGGATLLVVGSTCTIPTFFAVCRAGASPQTSAFGVCASDPRLTEAANVTVLRVGAATTARPVSFGPTSTALDIELFFCSDLSDFNFSLARPKPGVSPTDCVEK